MAQKVCVVLTKKSMHMTGFELTPFEEKRFSSFAFDDSAMGAG